MTFHAWCEDWMVDTNCWPDWSDVLTAAQNFGVVSPSTSTNKQSTSASQIAAEMELLIGDGNGCQFITIRTVAEWARQLRTL